jgi:methylated-DNA-[protein]-cysteine S-methyltransferase
MVVAQEQLTAVVAETDLGWAGVALSGRGIRYATLFHRSEQSARGELRAFGAGVDEVDRAPELAALLQGYARGDSVSLDDYPVDLPPCSELQRTTWLALREIPRGETRSYGWLARRVGKAEAPRAIGAMVGSNPIPLWLPCHRVVAQDGKLHGFGGGLAMKQALLEVEGALPKRMLL